MKKKVFALAGSLALSLIAAVAVQAVVSTTIVVTPTSPVFDAMNVNGVTQDGAPGFATGSFASNGAAKTDMYFTPEAMFGHTVTYGDVASVSYWTKKASTHAADLVDWFVVMYSKPYAGDMSTPTWYGDRVGAEPYLSMNLNDPANTWNQWTTDAGDNQLRCYESTQGAPGATFGSYTDPDCISRLAGNALSGQAYAAHEILYFSIQTGSCCAAGFTGQVDGLRVELNSGEVVNLNFEPFLQPADRDSCKKNGWSSLLRADGSSFVNQGDCVSYTMTSK